VDAEIPLRIDADPSGRTGTATVRIKVGEYSHTDKFDLHKDRERARFLNKVCGEYPVLHAHRPALEARLEEFAAGIVGDGQGRSARSPSPDELYSVVDGCLCRAASTRDGGSATVPICNFDAWIVEEIARDDEVEQSRRLVVEGRLSKGEELTRVIISTEEFERGTWPLPHWGSHAVVYAGQGNRDHLRAAIQIRSRLAAQRTVYTHTGWRRIGDRWAYLHAGGAIGPDGPLGDVSVELPGALEHYLLPDPPKGAELHAAILSSLDQLRGLAPDQVVIPLMATTWRAVRANADSSTHVQGATGLFKTELAALQQQHWGPGMDARHLPANWSSTANALEAISFAAKDALTTIDDFCPTGSSSDVARYHRDADRLFRGQGNRSGRQRCWPDGTPRPEKPPRGMYLSTGEDTPRGESLRARMTIVPLHRGDVDPDRLGECQRDAAAGLYARAMAGYLQWLAGRYDEVMPRFRDEVVRLRDELAQADGVSRHRRTVAVLADLIAAFQLFLVFAHEAGAIDDARRDDLSGRCRAALLEVGADQAEMQQAADPATATSPCWPPPSPRAGPTWPARTATGRRIRPVPAAGGWTGTPPISGQLGSPGAGASAGSTARTSTSTPRPPTPRSRAWPPSRATRWPSAARHSTSG
jgi:hypothetical protein